MDQDVVLEFLRIAGLNQYEASIYFALLKYGKVSRSELYKIAHVPQSRVYDVLVSLGEKGLVRQSGQSVIPEHPRVVASGESYTKNKERILALKQDLEKRLEVVDRQTGLIRDQKEILDGLEKMFDSPTTQHPVINKFLLLFRQAKREILCCTTLPILYPSGEFYKEVLRAVERGVAYRRVLGHDYVMAQGSASIGRDQGRGIEIRVIAEDLIRDRYYVVDEDVVFLRATKATLDSEGEEAFIFDQQEIVQAYRASFSSLWAGAKRLDDFLQAIRGRIESFSGYSDILLEVLEGGRTNREALLAKFSAAPSRVIDLVDEGVLKTAEADDLLIIDAASLLRRSA